jgi:hypothetical protein
MVDVTPDGARYLRVAIGERMPRPFHYRWLFPRISGTSGLRWVIGTRASLIATSALMVLYVGGWRGVAAGCMFVGCAGAFRFNWNHPVLVDAPALALALASACAFRAGIWPLGLALALLGGCARETSPVFAALFAWNPLALLGLVAPAVRHLQREGSDVLPGAEHAWILRHPIAASRKYHKGIPLAYWVMPWGAALVAAANPSPQLIVAVVVAYAQCLVATDTARLYQWAAPAVLLAAVNAVPMAWLSLLVILQLANPFAGEGL